MNPLDILGVTDESREEMRRIAEEEFQGKSPDYIAGYIAGVRHHVETMSQELLISGLSVLPMIDYLEQLKAKAASE